MAAIEEGLLGKFKGALHPRDREGKWSAKPGSAGHAEAVKERGGHVSNTHQYVKDHEKEHGVSEHSQRAHGHIAAARKHLEAGDHMAAEHERHKAISAVGDAQRAAGDRRERERRAKMTPAERKAEDEKRQKIHDEVRAEAKKRDEEDDDRRAGRDADTADRDRRLRREREGHNTALGASLMASQAVREADYRPNLHPRDRLGRFRDVHAALKALAPGRDVRGNRVGSGIEVTVPRAPTSKAAAPFVKFNPDTATPEQFTAARRSLATVAHPDDPRAHSPALVEKAKRAHDAIAAAERELHGAAAGAPPTMGHEQRIAAVHARIARLEQYRRYGEGYNRTIATHLHDAERFATPTRIDEAEHWIGRAEATRDAVEARKADMAQRRLANAPDAKGMDHAPIHHAAHPVPVMPKHEPKQLPPGPPPPPPESDTDHSRRRHADRTDPIVAGLLDTVGSRLRHVTIIPSSRLTMHGSDWDEGQRHKYTMVRLSDMKAVPLPRASEVHGNPFNYNVPAPEVDIPDGFAVVDEQVGYKPYAYVYANPRSLTPMLPEGELDEDVALVLTHTAALKNTYGGEKDIRFNRARERFGMTLSRWVAAQEKARAKGWLNKAGAITPSGRNAVEGHPLRWKVH